MTRRKKVRRYHFDVEVKREQMQLVTVEATSVEEALDKAIKAAREINHWYDPVYTGESVAAVAAADPGPL